MNKEIEKALEEESLIREFKHIGLAIGTRYEWQQLALDINQYFKTSPNVSKWVFMLCRKFPYRIVKENFEKSKKKGIRYFLACFRQNKG